MGVRATVGSWEGTEASAGGGSMPSNAWRRWQTARARELDEVEAAHAHVGGAGRGALSCLYLAPLKALVNDTARTLHGHAGELAALLPGAAAPTLAVRTGDTPGAERRALRDHPPAILLTTPESLAVLLSQAD